VSKEGDAHLAQTVGMITSSAGRWGKERKGGEANLDAEGEKNVALFVQAGGGKALFLSFTRGRRRSGHDTPTTLHRVS